jgi:methylenetetrahydrofolate dehydrogenase (NADP+)/methenyltetrahydrofolate cyclohydrolase
MSARRLDGAAAALAIRADLASRVASLTAASGRPPALSIVLVGDDPASGVYVRNKERAASETGLAVAVHRLPATAGLIEIVALVESLNRDEGVDGILVQSPLPTALGKGAAQRVFDVLDPGKDVDGFHPVNAGLLLQGRPVLPPCTPSGIIALLEREGIAIAGRHAVVVGRSEIVGKPAALLLLQRDATVTVCHSRTTDLAGVTRQADILIAAVGRPGFIRAPMVKPGAVVVDVGTTPVADRATIAELFGDGSPRLASFDKKGSTVVGDVHPSVNEVAAAVSPVPGGIGPLTIAMLLKNTLTAAEKTRSGRAFRSK